MYGQGGSFLLLAQLMKFKPLRLSKLRGITFFLNSRSHSFVVSILRKNSKLSFFFFWFISMFLATYSGLKVTPSASGIPIHREVTASIAGLSVQMESDLFSRR